MSVELNKNKKHILEAWKDVLDDKSSTDWAVFSYEGQTNILTVVGTGSGGIDEMKEELNSGKIMYAFCKVLDPKTSLYKYVLVNWQGEGVPFLRKGVCANHIRDISNILNGSHITINARTEEDVDSDAVIEKICKSTASSYSFDERLDLSKHGFQKINPTYKKVEPKYEINPIERDKFWATEEKEEKLRQLEEIQKKREEIRKLEEERLYRETEYARKREQMDAKFGETTIHEKHDVQKPSTKVINKIKELEKSRNQVQNLKELKKNDPESFIFKKTSSVREVFEKTSLNHTHDKSNFEQSVYKTVPSHSIISNEKPTENGITNDASNQLNETEISSNDNVINLENEIPNFVEYCIKSEDSCNFTFNHNVAIDVGLKAQALYDYQAADETEISFDPDDIITHIEQIDPGWWQGLGPDGNYGLFPANYVQLIQ